MATKRNIRTKAKLFNERLELIDELLYRFGHIQSRSELRSKVNARLSEKVSAECIDKDIAELKDELINYNLQHDTNIQLKFFRNIGYKYSESGFRLYKNSLSDDDKNLLLLANSLFNVFNGTPLQEKFSEVVRKIMSESLTGFSKKDIISNNFIQVDSSVSLESTKWIPQLLEAILEKKCLDIIYKDRKRAICPYVVKQYKNKWYMVAWDYSSSHKSKTNLYAITNIEAIIGESAKKYFVDPDFIPEEYFKYSLGIWHHHEESPVRVTLEFLDSAIFNSIISNPLHHSQVHLLNSSKDRLTVTFEVFDCPELYSLILSFGPYVKVLEPFMVAEKIKESALKTQLLY